MENHVSTDNRDCSFNLGAARWEGEDLFVANASRPAADELRLRWVDLAGDVAEVEACWTRGFYSRVPSLPEATKCETGLCIDPAWYALTGDFVAEGDVKAPDGHRWCHTGPASRLQLFDDRIELEGCDLTLDDVRVYGAPTNLIEVRGRREDGSPGRMTIRRGNRELAVWACDGWSFFSFDYGVADERPCFEAPPGSFELSLAGITGRYEPIVAIDGEWRYAHDCHALVAYASWEEGPVGGAVTIYNDVVAHARSSFPIDRTEVLGDTLIGWYQPGFDDGEELQKLTFRWTDRVLPIAEINGQLYTRSTVLDRDPTPCP